jgi:signal transduction histidine kinase
MNRRPIILAVDDTPVSLQLLAGILTPVGYDVRLADSGELALAAVAAELPDLILLDVRMEGIGGLDVCRQLKASDRTRQIPVILISAFAEVQEWVDGLQLGAADYITLPFRAEELLTRVKTHLALRQAHASIARQADEIRQGEEERRQLKRMMAQTQRLEAVGTLAAGVAHEINNPLNIVMNFAQLILDDTSAKPSSHEFAATIVEESERMARIVRNLLSFSRDEKEMHSPAEVASLIEQTLSLVRVSLRRDQIEVAVKIAPGLPMIRCRSQQIQQVLLNLLTNARDALNKRFPESAPQKVIQMSAMPFEEAGVRWIRLSVRDQGGGIPDEIAGRVFDPFFTSKESDRGTGLGLSISYGIVKEHRGRIWFQSEPHTGTQFHVDLKVDNGWSLASSEVVDEELYGDR